MSKATKFLWGGFLLIILVSILSKSLLGQVIAVNFPYIIGILLVIQVIISSINKFNEGLNSKEEDYE